MIVALVNLGIAASIGLLLKYLFLRRFQLDRPLGITRTIVFILLLAGVILTGYSSTILHEYGARREWPTTNGKVISSEIAGGASSRPQVIYEFEVEGVTLRDTSDLDVPGFGSKRSQLEVAAAWIDLYPPGSDLLIHYDPDNPSESLIRLTLGWDNLGKLGLGMTLIIVNLIVMMSFRRSSISKREQAG